MRLHCFLLLVAVLLAGAGALGWGLLPRVAVPRPVAVADLPGWRADAALDAVLARFRVACGRRPWQRLDGRANPLAVDGQAWQDACAAAASARQPRRFFETHFRAVEWRQGWRAAGFFTGYFELELAGSLTPAPAYGVPLYARPPELVVVDLGAFRDALVGQRLAGKVEDGRLIPYADRAAIEAGALAGRGLELVWVADPVEAFMLHIQGSGRVRLPDGRFLRVGYAGHNGHPYTAIGQRLIADGLMAPGALNLDSLTAWLSDHPVAGRALMRENRGYVFFRILDGDGPTGSLGTVLAPARSLAVDPAYAPLGLPIWVDTRIRDGTRVRPFRRLLLAEDTGGAIKGAGRGDIFFGTGAGARALAGHQKAPGRFIVLVPRRAPS